MTSTVVWFIAFLGACSAPVAERQPLAPVPPPAGVDGEAAARRLAAAIQYATVTVDAPAASDPAPRAQLLAYLDREYPRVHATLAVERFARGQLLRWDGSDPTLAPILFAAHLDVVPIEPGTEALWAHAPFAGEIADGFVWGRGALDDKMAAISLLEAAESLIASGFKPRRTVYLALGFDEEGGGVDDGAFAMARLLESRGVKLDYVLDEGSAVMDGVVPDAKQRVALVGITEKGYLTVELVAHGRAGHSSMPSENSAIGILASAVARLEAHPLPARLVDAMRFALATLAPTMPAFKRFAVRNLWLFERFVVRSLLKTPASAASVRTTTALTVISGGTKENVLPETAHALVNFRLIPGDTVASVVQHVRRVLADSRVEVHPIERTAREATPTSPKDSSAFRQLASTIRRDFPDALVVPSVFIGATDARHYTRISANVYRFLPVVLNREDLARFHGINERVSVRNLVGAIAFYAELMRDGK